MELQLQPQPDSLPFKGGRSCQTEHEHDDEIGKNDFDHTQIQMRSVTQKAITIPEMGEQDLEKSTDTEQLLYSQPSSIRSHPYIFSSKTSQNIICRCEYETSEPPCIHILAATGQPEELKSALQEINRMGDGEIILNLLDRNDRTVLHCASDFRGHPNLALECVKAIFHHVGTNLGIMSGKSVSLNSPVGNKLEKFTNRLDKDKFTPLYLAAKRQNAEVCYFMINLNADWDIRTNRGKSPAEKIFKRLPGLIARLIEESAPKKFEYTDGLRTRVCIDFGIIITYPSRTDREAQRIEIYEEMDFLSNMCYTPLISRMDILKQPIVQTLITLKWENIKWFVYAARVFQIAWFLLYSIFLIIVYRQDCPYQTDIQFDFHYLFEFKPPMGNRKNGSDLENLADTENYCHSKIGNVLVWILLVTCLTDLTLFQIPPIRVRLRRYWHPMKKTNFRKYFKKFLLFLRIVHAGKILFLTIVLATLYPVLISNFKDMDFKWAGWYILASIGVGLAWFNILIQIGKIPHFKVYIKMLTKVLQTLGVVLLIYSSLIIAFAMVFCIMMPGIAAYSSPLQSILKMFTFLIGEVNYDETFYKDTSPSTFVSQGATIIVFGIAIVILNIALLNFVIGLTVSDIQNMQQFRPAWENYTYLWQIFLFDTFLSHFPIQFVGHSLLKRLMLFDPAIYETNAGPNFKYTLDLEVLPKTLQKEIHLMNFNVHKIKNGIGKEANQSQSSSTTGTSEYVTETQREDYDPKISGPTPEQEVHPQPETGITKSGSQQARSPTLNSFNFDPLLEMSMVSNSEEDISLNEYTFK